MTTRNAPRGAAVILAVSFALAAPTTVAAQDTPQENGVELTEAYHVMQGVTGGLFTLTAALGLTQIYNLPTAFGDGACARDEAIFGEFACARYLTVVHLTSALLTVGSWVATSILASEAPDPLQGTTEDDVTDALGIATGAGLGLTAVLGLIAANPRLLGISGDGISDFQRVMRVVHMGVALLTASAFATHVLVDHID